MRIRTLSLLWIGIFGTVAIALAALLGWTANRMNEATHRAVGTITSLALADELHIELFLYSRVSNLLAAAGDPALEEVRATLQPQLRRLVADAYRYADGPEEAALLAEIGVALERYFAERELYEAQGQSLEELIQLGAAAVDRVSAVIQEVRELNNRQVAAAQAAADRMNRRAGVAGLTAAGLFLVGLATLGFGIHRFVNRPLERLHRAVVQFRSGDGAATAPEEGAAETVGIARAFNELAADLDRQRQHQLTFLAGVAHDLRNPLSTAKIKVQALQLDERLDPAKTRRTAQLLDRQIDRLSRMVSDLLDATRIEAGQLDLQLDEVDLRGPALDLVELFDPTSDAHRVTLRAPDHPVMVRGDVLRLEQVISNLISNAIKYSPSGGAVEVELDTRDDVAVLTVRDQGIGIPREELSAVFRPFSRQRRAREVAAGAGLGLSVVKRIVAAHGGEISVDSTPGEGSAFHVRLPLLAAARAGAAAEREPQPDGPAGDRDESRPSV